MKPRFERGSVQATSQRGIDRQSEIRRVQADLLATGFPRLKMLFIVSLTGGAGFLASFLMLHAGLASMTVRYPAAVGVAYFVFLFLLWLWLRTSAEDYIDLPEFSDGSGSHSSSMDCHGNVGSVDDGGTVSEFFSGVTDADEFVIPLVVIIAAATLALSSLWIIYSAPTLFAELLIDGVLSATLYRRISRMKTQHWLETAVHRTIIPFVITALVACLCAMTIHHYHPTAKSLGEVIYGDRSNDQNAKPSVK